ncbi:MAG: leucine-rich repeat domain-containing protein [Lachnospiraceae bacterium]
MNSDFLIDGNILVKYQGTGSSVVIPDGVTVIGEGAFASRRELTEVSFPAELLRIERSAFALCSVEKVVLPDSLEYLGEFAFSNCFKLNEVVFPSHLEEIDRSAFSRCINLQRISLPEGLVSLKRGVFLGCANLLEVVLPRTLKDVDNIAFSGCNKLRRVAVHPDNAHLSELDGVLYSKDGSRMMYCPGGLLETVIPSRVTSIGDLAFYENPNIDRLSLHKGLCEIGNLAFYRCTELIEIVLPESLVKIGESVFDGCRNLRRLSIPEGVTSIGQSSFYNCKGLYWLKLPKGLPFDLHWFAGPNDPPCYSADKTVIPFVTSRPIEDIDSVMGLKRAAFGFIKADMAGVDISPEIAAGYKDYIEKNIDDFLTKSLTDDEILQWLCNNRMIPPERVEEMLDKVSDAGLAGASVLLLDYQKRSVSIPRLERGGRLEQRFEALENALDF